MEVATLVAITPGTKFPAGISGTTSVMMSTSIPKPVRHVTRCSFICVLTILLMSPVVKNDLHCMIHPQANPIFQKPVSQLKPIPISDTWDRIGIDLIGPLPMTENGNR